MSSTTLEKLVEKRDQLNARIAARRARESKTHRARDTRRKIIFGATALKLASKDNALFKRVLEEMPEKDKALFDGLQRTLEAMQELREGRGEAVTMEQIRAEIEAPDEED